MSTKRKYQTLETKECSNCHAIAQVPVGVGVVACPQCSGSMFSRDTIQNLAKVSDFEAIRKKMGMSVTQFYAIPRDPPSASKLPIFDKAHTKNAMARFNQTKGVGPEERKAAVGKIMRAAKKFGIDASGFAAKYK